jgi:hypothetical protein
MASIFCPSCGSKAEYQFAQPNFCFKCGNPYSLSHKRTYSSLANKPSTLSKKAVIDDEIDEDDEGDDFDDDSFSNSISVPRIRNLNVDIEASSAVRVYKIEDLGNGKINQSEFRFGRRQKLH